MLSTHDTTNWAAWWEYEAGTVDEQLFIRKCADRGIDYSRVRGMLFHPELSRYGRLRWLDGIGSVDVLVKILGRRHDEIGDFIDLYKNSFREKEKLWNQLCLKGYMREKADADIIGSALEISQGSQSIFCIELITDLFYLTDIFTGDAYQYRMNTPGTISGRNWSLVIPAALEDPIWKDLAGAVREILIDGKRVTVR